jgi:hypothetical protein
VCHYVSNIFFLIPCSRVFLEKLTFSQLVMKFPAFYGTLRFITAFTSACHLPLTRVSSIQSIHHISLPEDSFIIVLPSTPLSPQWALSLSLTHQIPVRASPHPIRATCPAHLILLAFITHKIFCEHTQHQVLRCAVFSIPLSPHPS